MIPGFCLDVVWRRGTSRHRLDRGKVYLDNAVVIGMFICFKRLKRIGPSLCCKEFASIFIAAEDACSYPKLCTHICYRGSLGNAQICDAGAEIFDYPSDIAFGTQYAEQFEDDIFCGDPLFKFSCEINTEHFWACKIKRTSKHLQNHS